MRSSRLISIASLASVLGCATLWLAGAARAVPFSQFVDPNSAAGNQFGATVVALSTGNVVITSPKDDAGGVDAGAVYLFNGATGALINTLRGSRANDQIGSGGVTALANGNYVILSPKWDNGATVDAGAVTWGNGTAGVGGVVSAANSLVGSTAADQVGDGGVTALSSGNYVVLSSAWDRGAVADAGAVTWGSGTTGVSGAVSATNSLVGSTANDLLGSSVTALTNGNYVVLSRNWDNGATADAGAATWGKGTIGVSGAISAANSLVGSTANDQVGSSVRKLTNGNYVVASPFWSDGATASVGAATWGNGTTGVSGAVSAQNSLVGSTANDQVGSGIIGVTALTNGNYVVESPFWNDGATAKVGAETWGNGTTGVNGVVSAANSLVGSTANDQVGIRGVTPLTNGSYVVQSPSWDNGATVDAGAATWGNGTTGVSGVVSAANSLVGSTANDQVSFNFVTALTNGNYVVGSPFWDSGATANVGAATWGNGTTGVNGAVSAANSLVGSTAGDKVGFNVRALTNGNYVVGSLNWSNGAAADAGAATWGNGATGVNGAVSAANSLVGTTANDKVGFDLEALTNGNYVVPSPNWDNGAIANVGAATWGSGTTGVSGAISAANSLVGSTAEDAVGSLGVTALTNGNYVVLSQAWDRGATVDAGAVTWGSGTTGVKGAVSAANSLVGSAANDRVGLTDLNGINVVALTLGGYAVLSAFWDNGATVDAGAVTSGLAAVTGAVSAANSIIGGAANAGLLSPAVEDTVNGTVIARFIGENGGRVRVGPSPRVPIAVSADDIPADHGGWLRLKFLRSAHDDAGAAPQATAYGVWRHVPGTVPGKAEEAGSSAARGASPGSEGAARLRAALPATLGAREVEGRLYVTGPGSGSAPAGASFPAGTWESVASVQAVQQAQYLVAVPTVSDAAANDFVVTVHTTMPSVWFISGTVSGQSVNNQPAETGESAPIVFALEGARPNPARGNGLQVTFDLPSGSEARLDLVDVEGRLVKEREVGELGRGRHTVNLAEGGGVRSGIYWVRLTQGSEQQQMRVAVIE